MEETILSVDIGGSHITAAVIDIRRRSLVPQSLVRRKIDAHASAPIILDAWVDALKTAEQAWGNKCGGMAVSMPGPFDYEQGISLIKGMNKYEALYGLDIKQLFADQMQLPTKAIGFVNDAVAFLFGEALAGAGKGSSRVFGITLGTGLGSALFERGMVKDLNLGSSPFLAGIAEDYISTRGILACYHSLGGNAVQDIKTLTEGIDVDTKARKAIDQLAHWLANFLLTHIPVLKPDVIVVGGNISKAHRLFLPQVSHLLSEHGQLIPVKVAEMGEQAAMLGAAFMMNQ